MPTNRVKMVARCSPPSQMDYHWVEEWQPEGFCVALVEHRDPEDALSILVPSPETPRLSVAAAREWVWAQPPVSGELPAVVQAGSLDDWAVVIEEYGGFQATKPELLTALSISSRMVVVYRSVNADMSFQWAVNGVIVRSFDPLLYDDQQWGRGEPLSEEAGLPFGMTDPTSSAFACAERLTGVTITRELLDNTVGRIAVGYKGSPES
ncbi:MAG: DUF6461 domain-containing protein [Bryobacteraceae bacterium]